MPESSPLGNNAIRLDARDARVLLLWLLAALVGAGVAYRYFFQAFPEAAVNFQVTREAALEQARAFVAAQGFSLDRLPVHHRLQRGRQREDLPRARSRPRRSQSPDGLRGERLVLGRAFLQAAAERRVPRGRGPCGPHCRLSPHAGRGGAGRQPWTRASDSERGSFSARYAARAPGRVTRFCRPRPTPRCSPTAPTGVSPGNAPASAPRTRRTGCSSALAGDRIAGYQEVLQVPEAWQRDFDRMRSRNNLIAAGGFDLLRAAGGRGAFGGVQPGTARSGAVVRRAAVRTVRRRPCTSSCR